MRPNRDVRTVVPAAGRWFRALRAAPLVALILVTPAPAWAPPAPPPTTLPGPDRGITETEWLLPYVRLLREGTSDGLPSEDCDCCFLGTGTVTWFSESGEMLHELTGVSDYAGFLSAEETVVGLRPYWEMPFPKAGIDPDGFIGASSTGRFFVHLFHPENGRVQVDVYDTGRRTYGLGPFPLPARGNADVQVNERGVSVLEIVDFAGGSARVILAGPDGSIRLDRRVDSGHPRAIPAPDGGGFLWENLEGDRTSKYWSAPDRPDVPLDVWGNNSRPMCWTEDAVLMHEWSPEGFRFTLVDPVSGRSRWRIPTTDGRGGRPLHAVFDDGWIYLYDLVVGIRGEETRGHHRIVAVDAADGRTLHSWTSTETSPAPRPGRLVDVDGDAWFLTRSEFTRIDREVVEGGRHGWQAAAR